LELAPTVTQDKKAHGQGENSTHRGSSKNRYVGAVRSGFSLAGVRIWRKATDRTKVEVRRKLESVIWRPVGPAEVIRLG